MRPGFYIHRDAMDLCIEVLKVQYRDSKRIKLKIRWWNLGYTGKPWPLQFEKIEIEKARLSEWTPLTYEQLITPRQPINT